MKSYGLRSLTMGESLQTIGLVYLSIPIADVRGRDGISNWRSFLEERQNRCTYCNYHIDIAEAKAEGRIAVSNAYETVLWCSNCGKLNIIKTGGKDGEIKESS